MRLLLLTISLFYYLGIQAQDLSDFKWIREEPEWGRFLYSGVSSSEKYIYGMTFQSNEDKTIFFDSETGATIKSIDNNKEPLFIDDDLRFVQLGKDNKSISIVDFETLEAYKIVDDFDSVIYGLAVDNQNRLIFGIEYEGIIIWDLESGELLRRFKFPPVENFVEYTNGQIKLSCDGNSIFVAHEVTTATNPSDHSTFSRTNYITRYSVSNFEELNRYSWGGAFTIAPNCEEIAFVSRKFNGNDFGINIYDIETGDSITAIRTGCRQIREVDYSHDGKYIGVAATCGNLGLSVWERASGDLRYERVFGATGISFLLNGSILSSVADAIFTFKHNTYSNVALGENRVTLFPNPTNSQFTLTSLEPNEYTITLFDSAGQIVSTLYEGLIENEVTLDTGNQSTGQYYLRIVSASLDVTLNLQIQKK